jgi:hypothetical protein
MSPIVPIAFMCGCILPPVSTVLLSQETEDQKLKTLASDSRSRAEAIEVTFAAAGRDTKAKLHTDPIMKYTDVPRLIEMATLWVWEEDGRPVAIGKVEAYQSNGMSKWLYCFASASTGIVEGKWTDGHKFQAKKAGVEWKKLKGAAPQETAAGRQRQMKELFQHFDATVIDELLKTTDDLRPLARPLHEYSSPKQGVLQGILCGFTSNGTNPDVIVALEAVKEGDEKESTTSWRYSVIGMTAVGISVKLDKNEVFKRPYTKSPEDLDTWTYFWEGQPKR